MQNTAKNGIFSAIEGLNGAIERFFTTLHTIYYGK